ncbi:MAG: hypothetical protein GXO40_05210 [Epsilonproteobacteria bacterium]|jgi:hypothetical protein|nr:hypothetical protein [Campylobacterota bacterium]
MEVKESGSIIEVDGVIKTINDSQTLVTAIKKAAQNGSVILKINDSFSLPSTIIGELLKIKDQGVNVVVEVKDEILYELLDDLNLIDAFHVRKI